MPVDERYQRQVELLVRTLPHVVQKRCFAFFIVYLVSHHRLIERLLALARRDMREGFERGLAPAARRFRRERGVLYRRGCRDGHRLHPDRPRRG